MAVTCFPCNSLVKRGEKYLTCHKCNNNAHYACTSLSVEELAQLNQTNWKCHVCDPLNNTTSNTCNKLEIMEILRSIRSGQYRSKNILLFNLPENSDQNSEIIKTNNILSKMGVNIKPVKVLPLRIGIRHTFI